MSWNVVVRPEVGDDITEATAWYDSRSEGLGDQFVEEVLRVFDALKVNPFLNSRRHEGKNVRWSYPDRFPYRVIYEIIEPQTVIIAAVLHAAQHDRRWQKRL